MGGIVAFHALSASALVVCAALTPKAPKTRSSQHPRLGELYFWLLALALSSAMLVGARDPALSAFEIATPSTFALGLLGYVMAKRRPRAVLGAPWLAWHTGGQGGSFIGVVTATLLQLVPRMAPESVALTSLLWVAPTAVRTVLIARASARHLPAGARA